LLLEAAAAIIRQVLPPKTRVGRKVAELTRAARVPLEQVELAAQRTRLLDIIDGKRVIDEQRRGNRRDECYWRVEASGGTETAAGGTALLA